MPRSVRFFFFNDTATTEIYTLSLHDALPILSDVRIAPILHTAWGQETAAGDACYNYFTPPYADGDYDNYPCGCGATALSQDRKSTRLNSSHGYISYAVFCLKKKNTTRFCRTS